MKKVFLALITALLATSCASPIYYQLISVKAENSTLSDLGSPTYKQDGLEFTYNFTGEYGKVRFVVYNSNDYDVIVDMTRSAFIRNNIAEDYYRGREIETRIATGVYTASKYGVGTTVNHQIGASTLVNYLGRNYDVALAVGATSESSSVFGTAVKKEWQTAMVEKEQEYVRIPAHAAKAFCSFNINNVRVITNGLDERPSVYTGTSSIKFTKSSSPLIFNNRICAYKEGESPSFYDMYFYISEIKNVEELSHRIAPTTFYIPYSPNDSHPAINITNIEDTSSSTDDISEKESDNNSDVSQQLNDKLVILSEEGDSVVVAYVSNSTGSWDVGVDMCKNLGAEWHLPNENEARAIKRVMKAKNFIPKSPYIWTNIEVNENRARYYSITYSELYSDKKACLNLIIPTATIKKADIDKIKIK